MPDVNAAATIRSWLNARTARHRSPRRWPGSVTGGHCWWWRRCSAGPRRFNDLLGQIPGIAANILSERLKRLEREALLVARPYSERPPRAAYQLTAEGRELAGALRLLAHWGARHADPAHAPRHPACGTPLEARWYCPTCDHLVDHEPRTPRRAACRPARPAGQVKAAASGARRSTSSGPARSGSDTNTVCTPRSASSR